MTREIRTFGGEVSRRATADEGAPRPIGGYAAVFNSDTRIGDYFIERIAPGAFTAAIARDDVRCLYNHHDRYVIGRTASGTLRLSEDATGLAYEADPPDATWARDMVVSIERGDINQSSFAFRATREQWDETGELPVRTILEVELLDVSPVTYPAYDDSTVGVRAQAVLAEARSAGRLVVPSRFNTAATKLRMRSALDLRTRRAFAR
jgi:HK97 family phage prohead protease